MPAFDPPLPIGPDPFEAAVPWEAGAARATGRRRVLRTLASLGASGLAAALRPDDARAQSYPARPIRLVIPFPAGGATDIVGRVLAMRLGSVLGQQIVVENRPGAGGAIGAEAVAKAAPDGYTLLVTTSSTHSIGPVLNPRTPYDPVRDFTPIAQIAEAPSVLVVGHPSPARTLAELVAMLRAAPGRYNYGSSGIGTYPHLCAEMFKWRAGGLYAVHIPYRGTQLVVPDLVAGQIAFLMDSIVSAQPHLRDGKVRALAVSGTRRSRTLPDVPTFAEAGIPGMAFSNWFGMFGPANPPPDIVQRLNREINAAVRAPEVVERLEKAGADTTSGTPEQFARLYRDEAESWRALIARAGIRPE
jgi:tripartite-type tricarboxylate transporter receptor subunit TctC